MSEQTQNIKLFYKSISKKKGLEYQFDSILLACSPVIKRIRPSVLLNITITSQYNRDVIMSYIRHTLSLDVIVLKSESQMNTVLIYDYALLTQRLECARVRESLNRFGYQGLYSTSEMLKKLSKNFSKDSPTHEIGLFLGYPPEDVEAFVENEGRDYLFSGVWKVYTEPQKAKLCFNEYQNVRNRVAQILSGGIPAHQAVNMI